MGSFNKLSFMAVLGSIAFLAGCDKTFKISLTNTSSSGKVLEIRDPNGYRHLGMLEPGQRSMYKLKVDQDDLPAACTLTAGNLKKDFSLDKNARTEQYIYIEDNAIVGPLDENKEVKSSFRHDLKNAKTEQHEMITGQPAEPKNEGGANGGNVIEQGEVVE